MTTVRSMRPEERDDVLALLTETYQPFAKEMVPAVFEAYMGGVTAIDEGHTLVAVDGDTVLGTARLYLPGATPLVAHQPKEWTDPMPADWAWVRSLAVRPAARGTGIGAAVMAGCVAHAGDATAILLHTTDFMAAAVRLYERLGYERAPRWDFRGGRRVATSEDEMFYTMAYRLTLPVRQVG